MSEISLTQGTTTDSLGQGASGFLARSFRLEVLSGPDAGATYVSRGTTTIVGTHRSADFTLTDRTVSRFHCELSIAGETVRVRDLGSSNGTVLEGVAIESARLSGPTIVSLGRTELRFELLGAPIEVQVSPQEQFGVLVGRSATMRSLFSDLEAAARSESHVVLEGEAGVGKDAAAAEIHERSRRRDGPLDVIDCSAPASIVDTELFGSRGHDGALVRCASGTLILDDLGSLGHALQIKLRRAVEEGLDVRLIGTVRHSLRVEVNTGRFLPELYQLLAVLHIALPPLRQHPDDIPMLVESFLERLGARSHPIASRLLQSDLSAQLRGAPWPGNGRELRIFVERALAVGANRAGAVGSEIEGLDLPLIDGATPLREARQRWVLYFERQYLTDLLRRVDGNVSAAARIAGVDRVHLHRLIARTGLRD